MGSCTSNQQSARAEQYTTDLLGSQQTRTQILENWLRTDCDSLLLPKALEGLVHDFSTLMDSRILSDKESADLVKAAIANCDVDVANCALLFRGSDDGFSASKFHELCDGKGATLTVALTEFGHVIGGFTAVPWTSAPSNTWERDTGAWMFVARVSESQKAKFSGVNLPSILKVAAQVSHYKWSGPTFGAFDLHIADGCDANSHSLSEFSAARCDERFNPLALTGGSTLTFGRSHFRVVDYEVFSVR